MTVFAGHIETPYLIHPDYLVQYLRSEQSDYIQSQMDVIQAENDKINAIQYYVSSDPENENALWVPVSAQDGESKRGRKPTDPSKVAVIPVIGAMEKYSYSSFFFRTRGTQEVVNDIAQANANPEVNSIVLYMDTPGGMVEGTHQLERAVTNSGKPVYAHVNGKSASAGYWAMSGARGIYTSSPTDIVGSIGVMTMHTDISRRLEAMGVNVTFLVARGSENKVVGPPTQALSESHRKTIVDRLTTIRSEFTSIVDKNRAEKLTTPKNERDARIYDGSVFASKEAKELGLIDGTESLNKTIGRAYRAGVSQTRAGERNRRSNRRTNRRGRNRATQAFMDILYT